MRRPLVLVLAASAPLAALAADPIDSVDLEVVPKARVEGTLRPAEERESFFVAALRGSKVRAVVKRRGEGGPAPTVELLDAARATLVAGTPTPSGAKVQGVEIGTTAGHSFRVTGDGTDGDYRLDVTLTPRTLWTVTSSADVGAGGEASFAFAAADGATATIDLVPAAGSAFRPLLLDVTDPFGGVTPADGGTARPTRHRLVLTLTASGEQVVRFRNGGDAAGGWKAVVRVRAKPARRATTDLRDGAIGSPFDGAQAVFGRIADDDHATLIEVADGLNLSGVSITVPAGSLALPALISMTETRQFFVDDENHAAGTAVSFQPSGTTFDPPVQISVPFDPDAFDDGADAQSALAIVVEDPETGEQEVIAPSNVDPDASTATFPASHFSRFQPVSPRPRPLRGRFAEIELTGRTDDDFGAAFTFGRNGLTVNKGPRTAGPGSRTLRRATVGWRVNKGGDPAILADYREQVVASVAQVSTDDVVVVQETASRAEVPLARGRGGDVLATTSAAPGEIRLHACFRRTRGVPTRTNLAGAWHATVLDVEAVRTREGRVAAVVASQELELTIDVRGRVAAHWARTRTASQVFPDTRWKLVTSAATPKWGTIEPSGSDAVLDMPLGVSRIVDQVTLAPVLRGDLLVGGASFTEGESFDAARGAVRIVVLARIASQADRVVLPPAFGVSTFAVQADLSRTAPPYPLRFTSTSAALSLADDGTFRLEGGTRVLSHDATGVAAASAVPTTAQGAYRRTADGSIDAGKGFPRGRLTAGLDTLFVFAPDAASVPFGLGLPVSAPK